MAWLANNWDSVMGVINAFGLFLVATRKPKQ